MILQSHRLEVLKQPQIDVHDVPSVFAVPQTGQLGASLHHFSTLEPLQHSEPSALCIAPWTRSCRQYTGIIAAHHNLSVSESSTDISTKGDQLISYPDLYMMYA